MTSEVTTLIDAHARIASYDDPHACAAPGQRALGQGVVLGGVPTFLTSSRNATNLTDSK